MGLCAIAVDCWKVQRALSAKFYLALGLIPWIYFETKGKGTKGQSTANEYDKLATKYVSLTLFPLIIVYSGYTLTYDCHKGWYSYMLYSVATVVLRCWLRADDTATFHQLQAQIGRIFAVAQIYLPSS